MTEPADFTALPDLASRRLGGSVVSANDETFADKENLIKLAPPIFDPARFGNKGKVYDGWETRRRREAGHDQAIIRLGCAGIVHGVVVDTAFFRGNYPPRVSVEAVRAAGYLAADELAALAWQPLVGESDARGDHVNRYPVADRRIWTHVRLSIYPDGGVGRLRVHGEVVPDPAFLSGTVDLAALENGGQIVACSDAFYSAPANLIAPGRAASMADGWENARRRGPGNDYVVVRLAAPGRISFAEIDTSYFIGNAPGKVALTGLDTADAAGWELLAPTRVQPDTRHRFLVSSDGIATHVRLDIYPDGGLSRLRLHGEIDATYLTAMRERWANP